MDISLEILRGCDVSFLPIAAAFVKRMGIPTGKFHQLTAEVQEVPTYGRGRPRADGTQPVNRVVYNLKLNVERNEEAIAKAQKEAGRFVLITNASTEREDGISSKKFLTIYKEQDTVERNFGSLKDRAIVNALFLKTPARLEATTGPISTISRPCSQPRWVRPRIPAEKTWELQ